MNNTIYNAKQKKWQRLMVSRTAISYLLLIPFLLFFLNNAHAEGVKQVAPNPDDFVMLLIDEGAYGNFGAYNGPENSRLYFEIQDPDELVYLGLSRAYRLSGAPFSVGTYEFRIRRLSDGAVVHGPFSVNAFTENVSSWEDAANGPAAVTGSGYETTDDRYVFDPSEAGKYFIEFKDVTVIGYWDITVAKDNQAIDGRVYSTNWAFRTPTRDRVLPECVWDREFNGIIYSYTSDGFVSRIDFSNSGFQGLSFNVAFNRTGPGSTGDLELDRQSVPGQNLTSNSAEHLIFLNEPDINLFPDGECGELAVSTNFLCGDTEGYCIPVEVTRPGQVEVILDFNQNGQYDPELGDVILIQDFEEGDEFAACIPWDGLRGDGTPAELGDIVDLSVRYTQGVQHWALFDAEFLKQGFCVEVVRPVCSTNNSSDVLYWDDRNIPDDPGTNSAKDGRTGCECRTEGCRTFTNFDPNIPNCDRIDDDITTGYGDKNTLNTWWFASTTVDLFASIPIVAVQIEAEDEVCENTLAEISLAINGTLAVSTISWEGPNGPINSGGPENTSIFVDEPGVYTAIVTDDAGCTITATHTLTHIVCPIDIELDKSVDNPNPSIGDVVTFTIQVTNFGPGFATGVNVTDYLPNGLDNPTNISNGGVFSGGTIVWSDLTLDEGQVLDLTFQITVVPGSDYINLAEVTAMDQPDIDSTPGNGVDTDNDGNVEDDPDDEDDGDGVVLQPEACGLQVTIQNVVCDNNGTPADPDDDTFTFQMIVEGTSTSDEWVVTDFQDIRGAYNTLLTFGPYPITGGNLNFTVQDRFFASLCSTDVTVEAPFTCSTDCFLKALYENVQCDDNGTPADPLDDTYTVDITVAGFNTGNNWEVIVDGEVQQGPYDIPITIGPFSILEGDKLITIRDEADPACTEILEIQAPDFCSPACAITAEIENLVCDDNGTPLDASDDTYTFDLMVNDLNNASLSWESADGQFEGFYGFAVAMGPFPISGGAISLDIRDSEDPSCTTFLQVDPPATCSDQCALDVVINEVNCNDQGTESDGDDDTFTILITVNAVNANGSGWRIEGEPVTRQFGNSLTLGPYNIADGAVSFTVVDADDPECRQVVEIDAPPHCSTECRLETAISNTRCDDNGTPADPSDDVFFFDVLITGQNVSENGWTTSDGLGAGQYGEVTTVGPYPIADGDASVFIIDNADQGCNALLFIPAPETCSDQCAIEALVENVECDDNNTPTDASDDLYYFDLTVTPLNNVGVGWTTDGVVSGIYNLTRRMGPYPISDGNINLVIEDLNDSSCNVTIDVEAPATCSDKCVIEIVSSSVECADNDTPSRPEDDLYYFTVLVNGVNSTGNIWVATDGENEYTGTYGEEAVLGPFPIADGNVQLSFTDFNDPECTSAVIVEAPETCSDACEITETLVDNIECSDNNTSADPSDDTFTFELTVNALNPGGGWTASNGQSGAYGETVVLGPFPISGGEVFLQIQDNDKADCISSFSVAPPEPCSPDCLIDVEVVDVTCDDQGTFDNPFDDTFVYSVIVTGQNGGSTWRASDGTTGTYGELTVSNTHRVTEGVITITIVDVETGRCSFEFEVGPPLPEIECPEDTDQAQQTALVQTVTGDLTTEDLFFDDVDSLCWLPTEYFQDGDHNYDLINFKTDVGDDPIGYTFILYTDMTVNPVPAPWPTGMVDGVGTLFWGEYYPLDPCCYTQVSGTVPFPLSEDQFRSPYVDTTGLFDRPMTAVTQFAMMLAPDQAYSLLTTTWLADNTGHYTWVIVGTGEEAQPLIFTDEDLETATYPQQGIRYDLRLDDIETVLNNVDALDWLGRALVSDSYCGVDTITFADRLNPFDDCEDATIDRVFYLSDINGNVDSCEQEITFRRNEIDDVFLPAGTAIFNCGETFPVTDEGAPHPEVTGFPFVLTLEGYAELEVGGNDNITVVYKDVFDYETDDIFTVSREWSIIDECDLDTVNTFIQTIKVGGFSEPIIECPTSNHYCPIIEENIMLFGVDPFECTATLEVPFPVISSPCGPGDWMVRTEVYQDTTQAPVYTIGPDDDRTITNVGLGDYIIRYIVFDEVGREFLHHCIFRVADLQEPVAICRSGLEVELDAQGEGRLFIPDVNNGSYDNCGVDSILIRRRYDIDPFTCEPLEEPFYSEWGAFIDFNCCDVGRSTVVEMRVVDVNGNENMCWMYTEVLDNIPPIFSGIDDTSLSCEDLPYDFNPYDSTDLVEVFGVPLIEDNCGSTAMEISPIVDWDDCAYGNITRRFRVIGANGVPTSFIYSQFITVTRSMEYEIKFPKDTETDCIDLVDTLVLDRIGCDSFSVTYEDVFLPKDANECYNFIRTYHVINHCEWDGISAPIEISRDEDCDGTEGEEDVWVLRLTDTTYIDRDTFAFNEVPALQTKGTECDGTTNPKGYWREVNSTGYWTYTQRIKIFDLDAPEIIYTPIDPVCTETAACEQLVEYPFTVIEGCFLDSISSVRVFLDAFSNGTLDEELPASAVLGSAPDFTISHTFPIGEHRLELRVVDGCGNLRSALLPFEVRDCYVPDPVCQNGYVVNLGPVPAGTDNNGDGEDDEAGVLLEATDVISVLEDECTQPLRFSINRLGEAADISNTSLTFTCDDRYSAEVQLHVWDGAFNPEAMQPDSTIGGLNNKSCTITVYIQDEDNLCSNCADDTALEGLIQGSTAMPANSTVILDVENYGTIGSNDGYYFAPGVELGADYTVRPVLDEYHRYGITTLDILRIYRHIRGDLPMENPYQLIAADVNNTHTITTMDMVELRRLLLDDIDHFTNNTSYRFVPTDYDFPLPNNPWMEDFPESITVENVSTCVLGLDFVSLKVGDVVNGTYGEGFSAAELDERGTGQFSISAPDYELTTGEKQLVRFTVPREKLVEGYQFTLYLDPSALAIVDLHYGLAQAGHFGLKRIADGILTTSWNGQADLLSDEKEVELFAVEVEAKIAANLSELIEINSDFLGAEAYDDTNEILDITLDWTAISGPEKSFQVWQNYPNPFRLETNVEFEIENPGKVQLIVHNPEGQLIYHEEANYGTGRHRINILAKDLKASGLLYYTLQTETDSQTRRMILMK